MTASSLIEATSACSEAVKGCRNWELSLPEVWLLILRSQFRINNPPLTDDDGTRCTASQHIVPMICFSFSKKYFLIWTFHELQHQNNLNQGPVLKSVHRAETLVKAQDIKYSHACENCFFFKFVLCRGTQESQESKELKEDRYGLEYFIWSAHCYVLLVSSSYIFPSFFRGEKELRVQKERWAGRLLSCGVSLASLWYWYHCSDGHSFKTMPMVQGVKLIENKWRC